MITCAGERLHVYQRPKYAQRLLSMGREGYVGGVYIVPHLLWQATSVFRVSYDGSFFLLRNQVSCRLVKKERRVKTLTVKSVTFFGLSRPVHVTIISL